jgi:hypothetical protein
MTTTNEKTIEKTFAEYIIENYRVIHENINVFQTPKTEVLDKPQGNPLFPKCQGCIEGQPNQEAHINWGGCLSMYEESTEQEEIADNLSTSSYCSTTSYESGGENSSFRIKATNAEVASYDGPLGQPSESSILSRRAANSN